MLKGFPGDFPSSNGKNESGVFVRSEVDENVSAPLVKKAKIAETPIVKNENKENENLGDNLRHVKFSGAPPVEYLTFPESEYDRSPLNKPAGKWKRLLSYKHIT